MISAAIGQPIDPERGGDWVRGSLAQGSDLAMLVTRHLRHLTAARVLASPDRLKGLTIVLDDNGRGLPSSEADDAARRFLRRLGQVDVMTLVVEDDLARRGDPHIGRAAFVGSRIIRWDDIDDEGLRAAGLLRSGASGYPLNAFVCRGNATHLNLSFGRDLTVVEQEQIAASTCAVLVSVWDGEAYAALLLPELEARLE